MCSPPPRRLRDLRRMCLLQMLSGLRQTTVPITTTRSQNAATIENLQGVLLLLIDFVDP